MTEENRLVFAYAYMMNNNLGLPKGLPGYFVGNPDAPIKGNWEGRNNLVYAASHAARKSRELSILVDMNFEGLAGDNEITLFGMTLLLQPIQEYPDRYQTVNELIERYLPGSKPINPDDWQKQATIRLR